MLWWNHFRDQWHLPGLHSHAYTPQSTTYYMQQEADSHIFIQPSVVSSGPKEIIYARTLCIDRISCLNILEYPGLKLQAIASKYLRGQKRSTPITAFAPLGGNCSIPTIRDWILPPFPLDFSQFWSSPHFYPMWLLSPTIPAWPFQWSKGGCFFNYRQTGRIMGKVSHNHMKQRLTPCILSLWSWLALSILFPLYFPVCFWLLHMIH